MTKTKRKIALPAMLVAGLAFAPAALAQADPGEAPFKQRCQSCHTVAPGGASGPLAPNLRGVVGRKAASSTYKTYSPALKASKLVWTQANLDKYLAAPGKLVPGTRMVIAVSDPAQRALLIAYMAKQR